MGLPSSLALTDIPDASSMVASPVRNNFLAIQNAFNTLLAELVAVEAWQAYIPAWTSSGVAPVPNNGTITGRYAQLGKTINGRIALTMGTTTTYGTGNYFFSLPAAASGTINVNGPLGSAIVQDASPANLYATVPLLATSTTLSLETAAQPGALCGTTVPVTFATGDLILISFTYEAA